jgi:hypothetical protein
LRARKDGVDRAEDPASVSREFRREALQMLRAGRAPRDLAQAFGVSERTLRNSVLGLAERTGSERFAWDSFRRFVHGNVVRGVPGERFESEIARVKRERGVTLDTELDAHALRELVRAFRAL